MAAGLIEVYVAGWQVMFDCVYTTETSLGKKLTTDEILILHLQPLMNHPFWAEQDNISAIWCRWSWNIPVDRPV